MTTGSAEPPLHAVVAERRSLRAFAPQPVPDEVLASLFRAAGQAPSANNGQPWRFVLTRRGSRAFARLAATLRPGNAWAARAPVLVLAAVRATLEHPRKPPKENRLALLELGLAIGNLLAQATSVGVVVHPMAGFDPSAAREALGVEEGYHVGVVLALGYPGDPALLEPALQARERQPRERLRLGEVVFEGSWGEAFESGEREES